MVLFNLLCCCRFPGLSFVVAWLFKETKRYFFLLERTGWNKKGVKKRGITMIQEGRKKATNLLLQKKGTRK